MITPETGRLIYEWLAGAVPDPEHSAPASAVPALEEKPLAEQVDSAMRAYCRDLSREEKEAVAAELKQIAGTANYRAVTDEAVLRKILERFGEKA